MTIKEVFTLEFWQNIFGLTPEFQWINLFSAIIDLFVVWFLVFWLIRAFRGTRAIQLLKGVGVFIVVWLISMLLRLDALTWLMNQILTYGVIAGVVIFQPEIRKGLEVLGRGNMTTTQRDTSGEEILAGYEKAITYLAKRKIGALISIERKDILQGFVKEGIHLNADITGELLINIFIPNTPLHDGAVIIQGKKIVSAAAVLPLSEDPDIPKEYGTRHRAAIGLSEVSDAITIVVSEETGKISVTKDGKFIPNLTVEELIDILAKHLFTLEEEEKRNRFLSFFLKKTDNNQGGDQHDED